jgi:hypothetical protein
LNKSEDAFATEGKGMFQTFREAGIDRDEDDVAVEDEDGSGKKLDKLDKLDM